jgi:hypothetical protein
MHKKFSKLFGNLLIYCVILIFSVVANAQFRAAVQGTVTDSSSGVIAGATVTLSSNETGRVQTATTNEEGFYRFSSLAPGSYSITVEKANFKKQVIENLSVAAEIVQGADVVLEAGGISETVTVESEATSGARNRNRQRPKSDFDRRTALAAASRARPV